ncbi:MAG: carboxypeptidase M32 [Candidatus Poseidoniaceae archaeon]|jgi:carboxypeptidase Taq|tara:strand:+ start:505 stop:2001 length:1497 start_codon:yes stop_codon:yes gene_type:complete
MQAYTVFIERVKDIHRLGALQGHLGWDQETIMPTKGSEARSDILSWLAAERHNRLIDPEMGQMLNALEQDETLNDDQRANVREMRRSYDKAVKLPSEFVAAFAKAKSEALLSWQKARLNSDFSAFQPQLETLIGMTKEKIAYYGGQDNPYDVLLDEYEVGMKVSDYDPLFAGLRSRLVPLLQKITIAQETNPDPVLPDGLRFSIKSQTDFCIKVSEAMGFDFDAGRMDASTHPFSAGLWPGDTRFTTRFDELDPFSCLYAVMHETGHALYEQGLSKAFSMTPRGAAVSLGVHESQSRFWENQIGRTPAFWSIALPWFKEHFPDAPEWDPTTLNRIANTVSKGFIRVEADEVTYNLHVMLRYEIEKKIFNENLPISQLPETWNSMFEEWFGVKVPDDGVGCLQDIHWSMGAFGYFPTYTLGNLYAAQLLEAMEKDLGDIDAVVSSGDWSVLLQWLRPRIHEQGSKMTPAELIESATGSPPSPEPFLRYVEGKYGSLYGL